MDESVAVTPEEQCAFAERLVAMGRRLEERAEGMACEIIAGVVEGMVVDGEGNSLSVQE